MGDLDITRPLTDIEKQDTVEIGKPDSLTIFLSKLAAKQQEYQKAFKPFDTYGARNDFEEKARKLIGDINSVVDKSRINPKLDMPNLDKYGEPNRFELEDVRDVIEDKLLDGIRNSVKTGKEFRFRAKDRGNLVIIYVPNLELPTIEAWIEKNFKTKGTKN